MYKSREIDFKTYYSNLNLEYLAYWIRYKTYIREFDRIKFKSICDYKKDKIEKLSLRNRFPSVFNSDNYKQKYIGVLVNSFGIPNFPYINEEDRERKRFWDLSNYYYKGTNVSIQVSYGVLCGKIISTMRIKDGLVSVKINDSGKVFDFNIDKIQRADIYELFNF